MDTKDEGKGGTVSSGMLYDILNEWTNQQTEKGVLVFVPTTQKTHETI